MKQAQKQSRQFVRIGLKVSEVLLLGVALVISAIVLFGSLWPLRTHKLGVTSAPITDYNDAKVAVASYIKADTDNQAINPDCYPTLLDHGYKTEKVLVISHGYTSCPRQFELLAKDFYDQGYNVLTTRIPQHGYRDLTTSALADLTAEDMLTKTNEAVDIAQGLGNKVDLMGLSMGGPIVTWIGQNRDDINNTVAIDPMFSIWPISGLLHRPTTGVLDGMPNIFMWWNSELKANLPGPGYTYPRFGTKGIGQAMRFTTALNEVIDTVPAKTKTLTIITNGNDKTVDNTLTNSLVTRWRAASSNVVTYQFPATYKLNHDLIDPFHDDANIEFSYPKIIELTNLN